MNELATTEKQKAPLPIGARGIELESFEALWRFAQCVAASPFSPKGMEKPEAIVAAIQLGLEIGLTPMAALQNVAVINGRPGIYGDAALALVRGSGRCKQYSQTIEGEGDHRTATVISKRDDSDDPITTTFSVADAKKAGLWGKQGPWSQYPDRMLLFRARGFNLRDNFGDILKGLSTLEELRDHEIKKIEARVVSEGIQFGPAGIESNPLDTKPVVDNETPVRLTQSEKPKRHRRTKAEMEMQRESEIHSEVLAAENQPAPALATPLEGLRNLINASPINEDQFVRALVQKMKIEPHQKLVHLSDEKVIEITQEFMVIADEIIDADNEPLPF